MIPRHLLVAASAWISRIITGGIALITIPLLLNALGPERYALYAVLFGMYAWFTIVDFGLGTALQNIISEHRARGEDYSGQIATALHLLLLILVASSVVLWLGAPFLGPRILRTFDFYSDGEKTRIFLWYGWLSFVSVVSLALYRIWYAEQRGHLANLFPAGNAVVSLVGIWWIARSSIHDKLFWSVLAFGIPNALLPTLCLAWRAGRSHLIAAPRANWQLLLHRGARHWIFGVLATCVLQADYLIMSQILTETDIVRYNIASRIFLLVYFFYTATLAAIWPNCSEALARNDWQSVGSLLKTYVVAGGALIVVATVTLVFLMPWVLHVFSRRVAVEISTATILLFGFSFLVRAWTDIFGVVLQSVSALKAFYFLTPLQALISVTLQITLGRRWGVDGILLGLTASYLLTVAWGLPWAVGRLYTVSQLPARKA